MSRPFCELCLAVQTLVIGRLCEDCAADLAEAREEGDPAEERYQLGAAESAHVDYMIGEQGHDVA